MDRICRSIEGLCNAGAFFSALFMALIVILIVAEIVLRALFNASTLVAAEFSGYFLVVVVVLGLGYTLQHNAHIRITLVWTRLPARWQKVVDIAVASTSVVITMYALVYSILMVVDTYSLGMREDSLVETPLWIPQTVIPVGLLMLLLQLVAFIFRRLRS
jgi:TRAP-type C4-dicarboxylate transport system permease small subunit